MNPYAKVRPGDSVTMVCGVPGCAHPHTVAAIHDDYLVTKNTKGMTFKWDRNTGLLQAVKEADGEIRAPFGTTTYLSLQPYSPSAIHARSGRYPREVPLPGAKTAKAAEVAEGDGGYQGA